MPRIESPKMALGTAFHAAVEHRLRHETATFDECAELLVDNYENRTYLAEFREEDGLDKEWARKRGVSALSNWWDDVLPQLKPKLVEHSFEYKLYEDDERVIYMKGTIDLVDEWGHIWDWKTSGNERKAWKDQRGSVQAATYTGALVADGFFDNNQFLYFNYCVMHDKGVQIVELVQDSRHWQWLKQQAKSLALLVEADLPMWPVLDTDWHCNVNWCSVFANGQCKGAFFPEGFGAARKGN